MRRRRFLQIVAASLAVPGTARAELVWQGVALGADAELRLTGDRRRAEAALAGLPALLARVEAWCSLYRPSELTRLNNEGRVIPSPGFADLVAMADDLHRLTDGLFDPTVQPLWQALATGGDVAVARAGIGWGRVRLGAEIRLDPGQALTFNGLAQGHATDLVRDHLAAHGFTSALVNIGEYAALGGPFRLGIADPVAGMLAESVLTQGALAVSSPQAMQIGGQGHILHPQGQPPRWSTVAVEADSAALADGLSTALVFADRAQIAALKSRLPALRRVTLIDGAGDLQRV